MSAQQYALVLLPKFSGSVSMTFSCLILYTVVNKIRRGSSQVYDRLIMGMSITDLLGSFWMFMGSWPIPPSSGVLWAVGNRATCNLQGFFTQGATIASAIYNASLTFYFVLIILKQWKRPLLEKYEWCFHIMPWGWGLSTGFAGIFLKIYNSANLWCFIAESPDEDRGHNANLFRMLFFYGPLYLLVLIVTVNVLLVVFYVRKVVDRAILHSSTTSTGKNNSDSDDADVDEEDNDDEYQDDEFLNNVEESYSSTAQDESGRVRSPLTYDCRRTDRGTRNRYARWRKKIAHQNFRYAMAFYWTWLPISFVRMLQSAEHSVPFWLIVIACITTPVQGIPNLLVYFYPKYVEYQTINKETRINLFRWIHVGMQKSILLVSSSGNVDGGNGGETGLELPDQGNRNVGSSNQTAKHSTRADTIAHQNHPEAHDCDTRSNRQPTTRTEQAEAHCVMEPMSKGSGLPSCSSSVTSNVKQPKTEVTTFRKESKNVLTRVSSLTLSSALETIDEEHITVPNTGTLLKRSSTASSDSGKKAFLKREIYDGIHESSSDSVLQLPTRRRDTVTSSCDQRIAASLPAPILNDEYLGFQACIFRRASTDSIPLVPLRPISVNDEADDEGMRSQVVALAPLFNHQTSTTADTPPTLPRRAESEIESCSSPSFQYQVTMYSDVSPALPLRVESNIEECEPAPNCLRPPKFESGDVSPVLPRRADSALSEIEDDAKG